MDINLMTDTQFDMELRDAVQAQVNARKGHALEDARNNITSLIELRSNGSQKIKDQLRARVLAIFGEIYG